MMLNHNGIGFNSDVNYRIECDDESWTLFVKKDPHARYMRNKSWPQYEEWKKVFGKDRAKCERGIDVAASAGKIYGNKQVTPDDVGTFDHMTFQELFPDEAYPEGVLSEMVDESQSVTEGGMAVSGAGTGAGSGIGAGAVPVAVGGGGSCSGSGGGTKMPKRVVKKRKIDDKMDGVLTLMGQIHTDTNERLKEISARIGYKFELSTKRTEVFDQMKGIPGISLKQ